MQGELVLINSGTRTVTATITAPEGFAVDEEQVTLAPQTQSEAIVFTFPAPHAATWKDYITITADGARPVRAEIVCGLRPKLQLDSRTLHIITGDASPLTLTFRHVEGGPAYVTAVTTDNGLLEVIDGAAGVVQPGGELAVRVRLAGGSRFQADGLTEVITLNLLRAGSDLYPVEIRMEQPPRLVHSAEHDHLDFGMVMPGRARRRMLSLRNEGEAPLVIHQIELLDKTGPWKLDLPFSLPLTVRNADYGLTVSLDGAEGGDQTNRLLIVSNDPERPEFIISLRARVMVDPPVTKAFVGIDFGTSNSCICVARPGELPSLVVLDESARDPDDRSTVPSAVYFPKAPQPGNLRDCIIGHTAMQMAADPRTSQQTVLSIKRQMGRRHPERILGVPLMPQEIAARVIRYLVDAAEEHLGAVVRNAVVTVPANFTPPQVRATVEACRLAGLDADVVRAQLMDEPVGAAVDWLTTAEPPASDFHTLVYDFGGGTLDTSIIHYTETGGRLRMHVVSSKGDNAFGGDDLTELLRQHLRKQAQAQKGTVPADHPSAWGAIPSRDIKQIHVDNYTVLRAVAEQLKRRLSTEEDCTAGANLWVVSGQSRSREYVTFRVTLEEYEQLIYDLVAASRPLVDRALRSANLEPAQITQVLLVGKSSRTPLVKTLLAQWLECDPILHPDPKACVARGAFRKGEFLTMTALGSAADLVRELDRTNCRYGLIVYHLFKKRFVEVIGEGVLYEQATGTYPPSSSPPLLAMEGQAVVVALNRGDDDRVDGNSEVDALWEIVPDVPPGVSLPMQVELTVEDHRTVTVRLLTGGQEIKAARYEES